MVRDVRYITLSSSYRDLQEALVTGQLKTLALVESKGETCIKYLNILHKKVVVVLLVHLLHILHTTITISHREFLDGFLGLLTQSVFIPHFSQYVRAILLK